MFLGRLQTFETEGFCMGGHFIIVTKSYLSLAKSLGFVIVEANLCKDRKTNLPFHSSKMLW